MTKRELYTSLSRGKRTSDVNFQFTDKTFVNSDVTKPIKKSIKVNNEIDEKYEDGKIYKITFNN
jgi:hypothetical protein